MARATLREIELPDFGMPESAPTIPAAIYGERLGRLRDRLAARGYDVGIVYADREHSANLAYLTGFDPRFEEAVLIVGRQGLPLLLTGNECVGMAEASPLPMRVELHQDLSLPSQPRDRSTTARRDPYRRRCRDRCPGRDDRLEGVLDRTRIEVPAFIVDEVRCGRRSTAALSRTPATSSPALRTGSE